MGKCPSFAYNLCLFIFSCSEGFNFNIYKKDLPEKLNSQDREQLQSLIKKCSTSLRFMSYRHFMIFVSVFLQQLNFITGIINKAALYQCYEHIVAKHCPVVLVLTSKLHYRVLFALLIQFRVELLTILYDILYYSIDCRFGKN